mgnify:CR=1 FL=1
MERRFGRYAIRNLTMYLLAGYAIGYLLSFTMPQLLNYFTLEPALILKRAGVATSKLGDHPAE